MDLGERHAKFVAQAPETGEEDGAGEEVVLAVGALEHDGQIVLHQASAGGHWVLGEGALYYVEGFARGEVVNSGGSGGIEGGIALGKVIASE